MQNGRNYNILRMHNAIYMQIYLIFLMKVPTISMFPRLESMLHVHT